MKNPSPLIISISADILDLQDNRIFDPAIAKKYPGSQWAYELRKVCPQSIQIVTADIALNKIKNKLFDPDWVYVIQHGEDKISAELLSIGARPFLLTMFESPLYAGKFYDVLASIAKNFAFVMAYGANHLPNYVPIRFPSFSKTSLLEDYKKNINFEIRPGFSCMVFSNKFVLTESVMDANNLIDFGWRFLKLIKNKLNNFNLSKEINLSAIQLQTKRLDTLIEFGKKNLVDLFGYGWKYSHRLPFEYSNKLKKYFQLKLIPAPANKLECLANYKFNICFENVSYPDYITEKIFDAFMAGTIPVYLGPKNVLEYIPQSAFINFASFENYETLIDHLQSLGEEDCLAIVAEGRKFLSSKEGVEFSYEQIAFRIWEYFMDLICREGRINFLD